MHISKILKIRRMVNKMGGGGGVTSSSSGFTCLIQKWEEGAGAPTHPFILLFLKS